MAFNYDGLATTARDLIEKFGARAYLRRAAASTGAAYDPTVGDPRDWPIRVVDLDREVRDASGTLVASRVRTLLVSTEGLDLVVPDEDDRIMIGPSGFPESMDEFEIDEIRVLSPGGVTVMYEIDLVK